MQRTQAVEVVRAPDLSIVEFHGRVASQTDALSACLATVRAQAAEAPQTPQFDEYTLVLEGVVEIVRDDGTVESYGPNEGFFLPKHTRVQWRWPGPCKYVPICVPAFSPQNCGREAEAEGEHAKTEESMERLRSLHAAAAARESATDAATPPGGQQVVVQYQVTFGFFFGLGAGALLVSLCSRLRR